MAVTESYQAFVVEQLSKVVSPVRERRMFGGVGLYSANVFFALIDDDIVYLKTDSVTQPDFESRGLRQFRPFGDESGGMSYYQLPEEALEDIDTLRAWCEKAIGVARRAKRQPTRHSK